VRVFDIRSIKEWVILRGHKKGICCTSYLTLQLTFAHRTVLAQYTASHSRLLWVWRRNPLLGSLLSDRRPHLHQFSQLLHHCPLPPSPLRQHHPPRGLRLCYQHRHRKSPFARHSLKCTTQQSECLYSTHSATCSSPRETTTRPFSGCASDSPTMPRFFTRASFSP
jgi:hypothetical protein